MNQMINMILLAEKELEMERQGLRRTRRFIGDVSRVTDERWYQTEGGQVAEATNYLSEVEPTQKVQLRREERRSIFTRIGNLFRIRRQPTCNEC